MNEKLIVKNFGPIIHVDLEIKKTVVFIGPQSSGKSTVAKLLAIFRHIDIVVSEDDFPPLFQDYNINNYFTADTYFSYVTDRYTIYYINNAFRINKTDEFRKAIDTEQGRIKNIVDAVVNGRAKKEETEEQLEQTKKMIYDYNWKFLFRTLNRQIYIPAERILTSLISEAGFSFNEIPLPGCLKEFGKQFESTRGRIKELEIPHLNITYKYEEKGDKKGLRVYVSKDHSISLSECSSGLQTVIPMQVVMENLTSIDGEINYSFLVEEPELNLFPTTQKSIISYLIKKCNHKHELVITTHSPYVLSVLNNLIFANNVYEKNKVSSKSIDPILIENIYPKDTWIEHANFNAYYFSNGRADCIVNPKTNLIYDNHLDKVSLDIAGERDTLIELYRKVI